MYIFPVQLLLIVFIQEAVVSACNHILNAVQKFLGTHSLFASEAKHKAPQNPHIYREHSTPKDFLNFHIYKPACFTMLATTTRKFFFGFKKQVFEVFDCGFYIQENDITKQSHLIREASQYRKQTLFEKYGKNNLALSETNIICFLLT